MGISLVSGHHQFVQMIISGCKLFPSITLAETTSIMLYWLIDWLIDWLMALMVFIAPFVIPM